MPPGAEGCNSSGGEARGAAEAFGGGSCREGPIASTAVLCAHGNAGLTGVEVIRVPGVHFRNTCLVCSEV